MLDAHARLRVMHGSRDCEVYSYSNLGLTIDDLLVPGMFDVPAKRAGILPEYEKPIFVYILARDGPAIFCSTGVTRSAKGDGEMLAFTVMRFEKKADIALPPKRERQAA